MKIQSNNSNLMSTIQKVSEIKNYGNFRTLKNELGEAKLKDLLLELYPNYTIKEIEKITHVPDSTLSRWFKLFGIPTQKRWHLVTFSVAGDKNQEKIVKHGNELKKKLTVKITPDLAYLIGFSLGDGSIQKYMLEVFNKDMGIHQYLSPLIKNYGEVSEDVRDNGLWRLRLSSVRIANLIKKNNDIDKKTINYIFKRKTLAIKFIAAFWDAEGRVAASKHKYFHIYLYNTNKYLLDTVGQFLKDHNINYSVHSRADFKRHYFLKGRLVKARKVLHRISVPKGSSLLWAKEIGLHMVHSKKKKVVKEILSSIGEKYD
ncbi:MAG TPA: LAGLIDADG family homing endonuclease [Candidatus Acidoferrum sp.]|nr:LAGLIDADG family homing endonuclease [Candidatus Acidoferrum sp.]